MNVNAIEMPSTIEELKEFLKKGIEAYSESPVKNKNKLNEATAIGLGLKNQDALSGLIKKSNPIIKSSGITAEINDFNEVRINEVLINDIIFDEERVDFRVRTREEICDFLLEQIPTARPENKKYMKDAYKELTSINDEYILESIKDNTLVYSSGKLGQWNEICEDILMEHLKLEKDWNTATHFYNVKHLSELELEEDIYFLDDIILNTDKILNKTDTLNFQSFLSNDRNSYLFENIKNDKELQHKSILLLCYLVAKHRHSLIEIWDFDQSIIKKILMIMGISTEFLNI